MKKNLAISILAIVSILSMSYGYYQKTRADENELKAVENERIAIEAKLQAEEQRKLAERQMRFAEMNAMEAMKQRQIAEEALQKGNKKK